MSAFYTGLQATSSRLLAKFGKPVTISVLIDSVYDSVTKANVNNFTDITGNGVTVPIKQGEADGSLILMSDVKLIIENVSIAPTVGSSVTNDGIVYRVESVMPLKPANTNLIYTCILRK